MPIKINLLPPKLSVSKGLNALTKTLRALGVIGIAAFLVFAVSLGALFIVSTISLNGISANVAKLKSQVSSQEKSEQQIVLLKDRIVKITSVQSLPSSLPLLVAIEPFITGLSGSASINKMLIDSDAVTLSVNLKTNSDLSTFIESFQSSDTFKSVGLASLSFSPLNGYSVEVDVAKK